MPFFALVLSSDSELRSSPTRSRSNILVLLELQWVFIHRWHASCQKCLTFNLKIEECEWHDLENIAKQCHFQLLNQGVDQRYYDLYVCLATKDMLLVLSEE